MMQMGGFMGIRGGEGEVRCGGTRYRQTVNEGGVIYARVPDTEGRMETGFRRWCLGGRVPRYDDDDEERMCGKCRCE